jgi:hypothetical protein
VILVCLSAVERGLGFLRIRDPGSAIVGVATQTAQPRQRSTGALSDFWLKRSP